MWVTVTDGVFVVDPAWDSPCVSVMFTLVYNRQLASHLKRFAFRLLWRVEEQVLPALSQLFLRSWNHRICLRLKL